MWTLNRAQQSRVDAVEMSYLRGACGVTRWDGESNDSVYERCGMGSQANGAHCGVVEWVKRNTVIPHVSGPALSGTRHYSVPLW